MVIFSFRMFQDKINQRINFCFICHRKIRAINIIWCRRRVTTIRRRTITKSTSTKVISSTSAGTLKTLKWSSNTLTAKIMISDWKLLSNFAHAKCLRTSKSSGKEFSNSSMMKMSESGPGFCTSSVTAALQEWKIKFTKPSRNSTEIRIRTLGELLTRCLLPMSIQASGTFSEIELLW